jgi:hypothetical protein
MQVTGCQLRSAIRKWSLRRDAAVKQFDKTLFKFENEKKPSPTEVMDQVVKAETAIARLQEIQGRYNMAVRVSVQGQTMSLYEAIKRVGGVGRIEKMWRSAAGLEKSDRYSYRSKDAPVRNKDTEVAARTLSLEQASGFAQKATAACSDFQSVIAEANTSKVELEVDTALFE